MVKYEKNILVSLKVKSFKLNYFLQFASKSFEVHKDSKPIFELVLPTPGQRVSYRDGSIKIKVKVKVLIKSSIIGSSGFTGTLITTCEENNQVKLRTTSRIEDETVLEINFKDDLGLKKLHEAKNFNLFVDYIDDVTNKTFSAFTTFTVELSDHIIDIVHSPQFFKPGIPYSFNILVTKVNGYPVLNSDDQVEVYVEDDRKKVLLNGSYSLDPQTGGVEVETAGISFEVEHLQITLKYQRISFSRTVYKIVSSQKQFVSLNVLTPK